MLHALSIKLSGSPIPWIPHRTMMSRSVGREHSRDRFSVRNETAALVSYVDFGEGIFPATIIFPDEANAA